VLLLAALAFQHQLVATSCAFPEGEVESHRMKLIAAHYSSTHLECTLVTAPAGVAAVWSIGEYEDPQCMMQHAGPGPLH
jgi:hypothetical protein